VREPTPYEAHCMALGNLCVVWATIDRQLNDLMAALIGCSPAATACIASAADTVGARCNIMRNLVHEDPINEEWAKLFVKMLTSISGDLAARRNRFVHDYWGFTEGTIVRLDRRATAKRQQSRAPIKLIYDTEHVTPPGAVAALSKEISQMSFILHSALRDVQDWKGAHRSHASPPLLNRAYGLISVPEMLEIIREYQAR
jgi:hypothetical protein